MGSASSVRWKHTRTFLAKFSWRGQSECNAKCDGTVHVVAAGMHQGVHLRTMGHILTPVLDFASMWRRSHRLATAGVILELEMQALRSSITAALSASEIRLLLRERSLMPASANLRDHVAGNLCARTTISSKLNRCGANGW